MMAQTRPFRKLSSDQLFKWQKKIMGLNLTYDQLVDVMAEAAKKCAIKKNMLEGRPEKMTCKHSPEVCEYKRYVLLEAEMERRSGNSFKITSKRKGKR